MKDNLASGRTTLTLKVNYSLNARFIESESGVGAKLITFYKTETMNRLQGSGRAFSVNNNGGGIGTDATLLTREQRQEFEGALQSEIKLNYDLENPADLPILEDKLTKYFDQIFKEMKLDPTQGSFAADLAKLSAYSFSPDDLKPDQIKKLSVEVKSFFQSEEKDYTCKQINASASFLGFGGSAGFNYTKEQLRKSMEDKGWKFESEGNFIVPKSLSVFVFNKTSITQNGEFSARITRAYRQFLNVGSQVTTDNLYYPKDVEDKQSELEALKAIVAQSPPVGTIVAYGGNLESVPINDGWLVCDGTTRSVQQYPELAKIIGNWGSANAGMFKLPDLRGKFLRGLDPSGTADPDGKNRVVGDRGEFQRDMTRQHNHPIIIPPSYNFFYSAPINDSAELKSGLTPGTAFHDAGQAGISRVLLTAVLKTGNNIQNDHSETRPINLAVHYIIKAKP